MLIERFVWLAVGLPLFWLSTMFHEMAHAWAAYALGERGIPRRWLTSFDPRLYVDTLGSVLFGLTWLSGTFFLEGMRYVGFGWGRSAEFRPGALRHPQRDMLLVALAGPLCNLLQAVLWYGLGRWVGPSSSPVADVAFTASALNLVLATFNLIPLPPLDGATILANLLSRRGAVAMESIQPGIAFLLLWVSLSVPAVSAFVLLPALWLGQLLGRLWGGG